MDSSQTSLTLLADLRDPNDQAAWTQFDKCYRPLILELARRLGLDEHDAADAAQRTVLEFRKSFSKGLYKPEIGRFKNWLLGIARHQIADILAQRAKQPIPAGQRSTIEGLLAALDDPARASALWDDQWRAHIIRLCFDRARREFSQRDIQIFRMLTVNDRKIEDVAEELGMSYTAVRQVKHRILTFMRKLRPELEGEL